jgi:glycosyltransferase involved in cell wall biosynthesis
MELKSKIAVICNYELLQQRVGGMDYFFWMFDEKCKTMGIDVDWYFPNTAHHGHYSKLNIIASGAYPERFFIENFIQNQERYSHVITHFLELCTWSFKIIKKITKAKIIAVDHNPRPINGYQFKKRLEKKIKGFLYEKYIDVFVAVSEATKTELLYDFGNIIKPKCIVIFNGLDPAKFRKKTHFGSTAKFMIASHLRESKGVQDVILAVSRIKKYKVTDFTIDIYGEGPFENSLKEMTMAHSLNETFIFKGSVPNLFETYADYDCLIHPSHAETFCYSVVESLMSNLPVITTHKQGNVLGLVQPGVNGFLYEAGNTVALEKILNDITDGKVYSQSNMSHNIRLDSLTLDQMVENYFKLLS